MSKTSAPATHILLTTDLRQYEPLAYWVPAPSGHEEDHFIVIGRLDAENKARECADDEEAASWPIYPLYAGESIVVL